MRLSLSPEVASRVVLSMVRVIHGRYGTIRIDEARGLTCTLKVVQTLTGLARSTDQTVFEADGDTPESAWGALIESMSMAVESELIRIQQSASRDAMEMQGQWAPT